VNARSPSVEQRVMVVGTISCDVAAELRCRRVVTSGTRWKLLASIGVNFDIKVGAHGER